MSEFSKQFNVWHIANDKKYRTATLYRKALCKKFRNWKSPVYYSELSQEVRTLKIENEKLKADNPVIVPKFVDGWYNVIIGGTFSAVIASYAFDDNLEAVKWVNENGGMELLCKMYLYGYTVEKEKLYLLKHIDISSRDTAINYYLTHTFTSPFIGHTGFSKLCDMSKIKDCHFIQSEIDGMEIGSYEQIEVEP